MGLGGSAKAAEQGEQGRCHQRSGYRHDHQHGEDRAIDHAQVEADLDSPLVSLDRSDKQRAVALLHERGAFALRRSTDAVAEAMGVSRITIYNYLNALETPPESG